MTRRDLEHVIRASGAIAELLVSQEVDLYPLDDPAKADLIDGSIGELSPFHEQFGYYAHGVGPETAILPSGWRERLVPVRNENTRGVTGHCLAPADLAVSKLLAGPDKDLRFVSSMLRHRLVAREQIDELLAELSEENARGVARALAAI